MASDTLKRISESVCSSEYLGINPTSNGTKPPHIANGLFRNCTGETCSTADVHDWILCEGKKDAVSSKIIIEKYSDIFVRPNIEQTSKVRDFRFLLYEIFDQDNTVYPNYEFSVTTIPSHWFLKKRVNSEAHIGDFIFEILSKTIDGKRSSTIKLISDALANDNDDLTNIVKPIVSFPSDKEKRIVNEVEYPDDSEIMWDSCKNTIRKGFDRLSVNIEFIGESKNSLLTLRRIVNYAVFSTLLYLIQVNSAKYNNEMVPIVIDAGGGLDSIKNASEQSFISGKKSVEDYYVNAIREIINDEIASDTDDNCKRWISEMVFSSEDRELDVKKAVNSYYSSFTNEGDSPLLALAKALQIALYTFEYKTESPSTFCRVLGVRAGLVGPKGNRANIKRYLANSFTLETIALSVLNKEDLKNGIELKELAEKLEKEYSVIIGANSESDYDLLERANIAQSTPGDLRGDLSLNAQKIANTYISLGLGKRYADGVTLIGWRL